MFSPSTMQCFLNFFAYDNMKKTDLKSCQIQPKSQFLFHKNLPPRDFSIMTLVLQANLDLYHYLRYVKMMTKNIAS